MANRKTGMFRVEPNQFTDDRLEDGVATLLRRRREELGQEVAIAARQLRIRAVYIHAIEDGRLQDLPGTAYAVGFVRAYADYLGLDGNSIVGDYRDELSRLSRRNQLIWPADQVEHKHFPGGIVLFVSLLVAGALYGGWYFASQPGGTGIDFIDQVPDFMKKQTEEGAPGNTPAAGTAGQSGAVAPDDAGATDPGPTPSSAQAAEDEQVPPLPAASDAAAAQPVVVEPQAVVAPAGVEPVTAQAPASAATQGLAGAATAESVPPAEDDSADSQVAAVPEDAGIAEEPAVAGTRRVVVRATRDSWVEIFDANDEPVLQRILRAGETFAVPDQPGLTMDTGNAGGIVIELDGRARSVLGSIGVVKRGVALDPAALGGQ